MNSTPLRLAFACFFASGVVLAVSPSAAAAVQVIPAGATEPAPPVMGSEGVVFECYSPSAKKVFLAGSFNNWADNREGLVSDDRHALRPVPGRPGFWTTTVALPTGRHLFRFVLDTGGAGQTWLAPARFRAVEGKTAGGGTELQPPLIPGRDHENNIILCLAKSGRIFLGNGVAPDLRPEVSAGAITFRYWAPEAAVVYLAGNFNEWARNQDGRVTLESAQMDGPDLDGVWTKTVQLPTGQYRYQYVVDGRDWRRDPNALDLAGDHALVGVK